MVNPFLKRTLEMWNGFGATSEPHLWAEVISSSLAGPAVVAWHSDLEGNSVTDAEPAHTITNCLDHTRRLVAKGQRSDGLQITIAEFLVIGHI
jgi:hypothetical protein